MLLSEKGAAETAAQEGHAGRAMDTASGYGIIDCRACGFIHMDPVPAPAELKKVYVEEYYTEEKPLFIERVKEDIDWWNVVYDDRYEFFEGALPAGKREILDIGCGPGYFLKRGLDRGWRCLGIEPSKQAGAHAKGLGVDVMNAFFDEGLATGLRRKFDAIHLSEVLEHVPDPASILRLARGLLNDAGVLCAVVPNDYSPVQRVLREKLGFKPYWLAPPHHINYFSFSSLSGLFEKTGFKVIEKTSMFPIDFFLLMGDDYIGNDPLGRACHARRKRLDVNLAEPVLREFKKEMYRLMARHSIGREMIVFGRKTD